MSRIVAIDYGRKRTGIAVSDTMQLIANGLTTVPTHELLNFIGEYIAKEPVERIIIGLPKQMNNEVSENMKNIEPFVRSLKKRYPDLPVEYVDERFTSVLAHRTMLEAGLKKKDRQNKALVDEISATIILQTYLVAKAHTRLPPTLYNLYPTKIEIFTANTPGSDCVKANISINSSLLIHCLATISRSINGIMA